MCSISVHQPVVDRRERVWRMFEAFLYQEGVIIKQRRWKDSW